MTSTLPDDDRLVVDAARTLFERIAGEAPAGDDPRDPRIPLVTSWPLIADGGWHDLPASQPSFWVRTAALVAQEAGRAALPIAFTDHCIVAPGVLSRRGDEPKAPPRPEPDSARPWCVAGWEALVDGLRGDEPISATREKSGWRLTGSARRVPSDGYVAGALVVAVDAASGRRLVLEVDQLSGVGITPVATMDHWCGHSRLDFHHVFVDQERELGPDTSAFLVDLGALGCSAEALGAAEALLEMSVRHVATREQFGRPIGSFQAVKHHCANMLLRVEAMRAAVAEAALALESEESPAASLAVSVAKSYASSAAREVAETALQLHGGMGFTWEHPLHRYLKRVLRLSVAYGGTRWHRARLAAHHLAEPRA
jgi:alkylation response protein AidB-like acyl-CoA dehydrogenase